MGESIAPRGLLRFRSLRGCNEPGDDRFKLFAGARQQFCAVAPEQLGVQALERLKTKWCFFLPIMGSPPQKTTVTTITPEEKVQWRTRPHNSWSSPDPCTYENPAVRRSAPSFTARDALTHITGKNDASDPMCGKHVDAGVIHSERNGLVSSGRTYDEACVDGGS